MSERSKRSATLEEAIAILQAYDSEDEASFEQHNPKFAPDDPEQRFDDDGSNSSEGASSPSPAPSTSKAQAHVRKDVMDIKNKISPKLKGVINHTKNHRVIGFENLSPYECFQKLFPDEIFDVVTRETNKYAKTLLEKRGPLPPRSRLHHWKEVTAKDIRAFVAVEIGMGLIHKPTLQSYFSENNFLLDTPGFGTVFSRDNYTLIRSCLHFADNEQNKDSADRLYKIRPILDILKDLYSKVYVSNRELGIDESMIKFKDRLFFKQCLPSKPSTKLGIKLWTMCDLHTGYLLKFEVYVGKETSDIPGGGLVSRVVQTLLRGYENKGHIVFMDRFYSSVALFDPLRLNDIETCETVPISRKGLSSDMKNIKQEQGELPKTLEKNNNSTMLACSWQDTEKTISTIGTTDITKVVIKSEKSTRKVDKPSVQVLYSKYMGGGDMFDQQCLTYPFNRRSVKWYQSIWYFLIESALINSYICYTTQNPNYKLDQKKFRDQVIYGLLEGYETTVCPKRRRFSSPLENRLTERHFTAQYEQKSHKPHCKVCSILPSQCKKRGQGSCKRKQTSFFCNQCLEKPPLCLIPCFEIYHTQKKYRKTCQCE